MKPMFPLRRAAVACALAGLLLASGAGGAEHSLVNRPAPEFSRTDLQGARIDLAHYKGKVVLLNFWATWCAPCRVEMPRFVRWQQQYGPRGFQVIGVSIDDSAAPVRPFVAKMRLNYPVLMGDARLGDLYGGVYGVPVSILIDRHGIIRARLDGGGTDLSGFKWEMLRLLAAH